MTLDYDSQAASPLPPSRPDQRREDTWVFEHRGPFPDPYQVQAYEEAAPGAGSFVLAEAAKADQLRQTQALEAQRRQDRLQALAIIAGLAMGALAFATGSVSLLEDLTYEGLALSGTGLIGLVLAFIKAGSKS